MTNTGMGHIAIFTTDNEGTITLFNQGAENLLGYRSSQLIGKFTPLMFHEKSEILNQKNRLVEQSIPCQTEFDVFKQNILHDEFSKTIWNLIDSQGQIRRVRLNVSAIGNPNEKSCGYLFMATPLSQQAIIDDLELFANKNQLIEHVNIEMKRMQRANQELSMVTVGLDYFEAYQQQYNQDNAQHCLKEVSTLLYNRIQRSGDYLAYLDYERFAIYLPHTAISGAIKLAETLRLMIYHKEIPHDASPHRYVTISCGIGSFQPKTNSSAEELLLTSLKGLELAQKEKGNCSRINEQ